MSVSLARHRPTAALVLAAVSTCAFAGCAASAASKRAWIPSELTAASEHYPVAGRVQMPVRTVSFGPYQTVRSAIGVKSGEKSVPSMLNGQLERATSHQTGYFELATPSGKYTTSCIEDRDQQREYDKKLVYDGKDGIHVATTVKYERIDASFRCTIRPPSGAPLKLELTSDDDASVQNGEREIGLMALQRDDSGAPRNAYNAEAYLLVENDVNVGALELSEKKESVTLRRDLAPQRKDELAAICMALLLRRDMR